MDNELVMGVAVLGSELLFYSLNSQVWDLPSSFVSFFASFSRKVRGLGGLLL